MAEVFDLIKNHKNHSDLTKLVKKQFPKSKGHISKLNNKQLEELIPVLREATSGGSKP